MLNKLVPTDISVKISVDGLTKTWEIPLSRRGTEWHFVWDNIASEWEVPVEATGRWIHFVFQGTGDDVMCTAHSNSDDTAVDMSKYYKAKMAVIKVESILPNIGKEVDDLDKNYNTKVFVISVTNTIDIIVTATISPTIAESDLPMGCTMAGGQGSGKLQRTVSAGIPSKTEFTFTCCGADSGLKTTVYVYDAKLGLYADAGDWKEDKYGHSGWGVLCR